MSGEGTSEGGDGAAASPTTKKLPRSPRRQDTMSSPRQQRPQTPPLSPLALRPPSIITTFSASTPQPTNPPDNPPAERPPSATLAERASPAPVSSRSHRSKGSPSHTWSPHSSTTLYRKRSPHGGVRRVLRPTDAMTWSPGTGPLLGGGRRGSTGSADDDEDEDELPDFFFRGYEEEFRAGRLRRRKRRTPPPPLLVTPAVTPSPRPFNPRVLSPSGQRPSLVVNEPYPRDLERRPSTMRSTGGTVSSFQSTGSAEYTWLTDIAEKDGEQLDSVLKGKNQGLGHRIFSAHAEAVDQLEGSKGLDGSLGDTGCSATEDIGRSLQTVTEGQPLDVDVRHGDRRAERAMQGLDVRAEEEKGGEMLSRGAAGSKSPHPVRSTVSPGRGVVSASDVLHRPKSPVKDGGGGGEGFGGEGGRVRRREGPARNAEGFGMQRVAAALNNDEDEEVDEDPNRGGDTTLKKTQSPKYKSSPPTARSSTKSSTRSTVVMRGNSDKTMLSTEGNGRPANELPHDLKKSTSWDSGVKDRHSQRKGSIDARVVSPYRDNVHYLRDQFRLMRLVEDRNKLYRDSKVAEALGADLTYDELCVRLCGEGGICPVCRQEVGPEDDSPTAVVTEGIAERGAGPGRDETPADVNGTVRTGPFGPAAGETQADPQQPKAKRQRCSCGREQDLRAAALYQTQQIASRLRDLEKALRRYIKRRLICTWDTRRWLPRLEVLAKAFELSRFEKLVLVALVARYFSKVYLGVGDPSTHDPEDVVYIQDLARSFLPRLRDHMMAPFTYFSSSSSLVRESVLTVKPSLRTRVHPMLSRVEINPRIAEHLLGVVDKREDSARLNELSNEGVHESRTELSSVILPPRTRSEVEGAIRNLGLYLELQRRASDAGDDAVKRGYGTIFVFAGKAGSGKTLLADAVATELGKKVAWSGRSGRPNFPDLFMQAKMHDAVVVAHVGPSESRHTSSDSNNNYTTGSAAGRGGANGSSSNENRGTSQALLGLLRSALDNGPDWTALEDEMGRHNDLVILTTTSAACIPKPIRRWVSLYLELDEPDHILQRQLWESLRPPDVSLHTDVDFSSLSLKWPLNAGLIKQAWVSAYLFAVLRDGENPCVTQADLMRAARGQLEGKLRMDDTAAETGKTGPMGLERVVLPQAVKDSLAMIVNNAKACHVVYGQWGFRQDHMAAAGVRALFWGPPGTGKTQAAHSIAFELGRPLRIASAAQLISKFVGDTGKNLQALFHEARDANAVLLFDEAEGLFSQRGERAERHDLTETNLLLQLVEGFEGVMVATTNRPDLLDVAFRRRFDIWVEFTEPTERERAEIWRLLVPPQAPVDKGLDYNELGRKFALSGGHIKSAVRRAAMRAALRPQAPDQVIRMSDMVWAAGEELKKRDGGSPTRSTSSLAMYS